MAISEMIVKNLSNVENIAVVIFAGTEKNARNIQRLVDELPAGRMAVIQTLEQYGAQFAVTPSEIDSEKLSYDFPDE